MEKKMLKRKKTKNTQASWETILTRFITENQEELEWSSVDQLVLAGSCYSVLCS